eukprot:31118-Pelagococcus_subviridis.AAC.4
MMTFARAGNTEKKAARFRGRSRRRSRRGRAHAKLDDDVPGRGRSREVARGRRRGLSARPRGATRDARDTRARTATLMGFQITLRKEGRKRRDGASTDASRAGRKRGESAPGLGSLGGARDPGVRGGGGATRQRS